MRLRALLALTSALALVLAACGNGDEPAPTPEPAPPAEGDTPDEPEEGEDEFDVAAHFEGQTVTILVGFSAGGGMDSYARLAADHLPRFLPGSPDFVVENTPGAGGAVVGGMIQHEVEPDGYTLGFQGNFSLPEAIGDDTVPFQPTEIEFIGDLSPDPPACLFRTDIGSTLDELREVGRPLNMGSTGPSAAGTVWASAMEEWMGLDVNVVSGYPGTQEIQLAFEQGELDGYCNGIASVFIDAGSMFNSGDAVIVTYWGADPLGGVFPDSIATFELTDDMWAPNMIDDPEHSAYAEELGVLGRGYHKAFSLPPGTPEPIIEAYASAMAEMVQDQEFLDAAEQVGRPIQFVNREQLIQRTEAVFTMSDPVRELLEAILIS